MFPQCLTGSFVCMFFIRYEPRNTDLDEEKRQQRVEKINSELLKKLMELDTDLEFSGGK